MNRIKWWLKSPSNRDHLDPYVDAEKVRELKELKQLLADGALTKEDYQMKKEERGLSSIDDDFM